MPNADESEYIQAMRKQLMEMELDELKTGPLAEIKEMQPDVELPSGAPEIGTSIAARLLDLSNTNCFDHLMNFIRQADTNFRFQTCNNLF